MAVAAAVLRTVVGERDLVLGLREGGREHRLDITVVDGTWRALRAAADQARATARPEVGRSEVLLDLDGANTDPAEPVALVIALHAGEIRLRHRGDLFDAEHARRLGGYLRGALRAALTEPDARHDAHGLPDAEETHHQVHGLAGPTRPVGEAMFPELFAQRVRAHPDAPAVSHGDRAWTYRELDERSDRVAAALLGAGLVAEDVVGVVTERTLGWVAATLGVLKAGGVYMPIRPGFPADRIRTQLEVATVRFTLSEAGSHATLDTALAALPQAPPLLLVEDLPAATAPPVPVGPGQLAYIYFTSGSTGLPKGAMCEHASMVNHLRAKIDDLDLDAGTAVAQTASQCFDISLWQLVAPLLVGGRVRLVDTDTQLDVPAFLDELAGHGIGVVQLVPSYFEVLLTELERHPRELGPLRSISVTGEALKLDLVRRWFARYPEIALVNAYGATEVGDDTMHEVLTGEPGRGFVTVGRSLRNVRTYVLDPDLRLVPLGSPGEIAFAGVCVGRGYINDEERTRQAFADDPHVPGERLYRTGDFGRWLPEGRIEFLGRRDQQVKIRGFRIEIGEVEGRLLELPGVRGCAVVVDGEGEARKLVGFYAGPDVAEAEVLAHLAAALPDYMVPGACHRMDSLPLTENGKVDRKVLRELAATLGHAAASYAAPTTVAENALATAWAEVLGVPVERISRADRFFQLGGTSLAAVRLVVRLDRRLSLRDLAQDPSLSELALRLQGDHLDQADQADRPRPALLHRLSPDGVDGVHLVCFPYAGGNAVNFRGLAGALAEHGVVVFGVELPGHDLSRAREEFADVGAVAAAVRAEVAGLTGPVAVWGHCAGAAHAVELARLLAADGESPAAVFVGAAPLSGPEPLRAEITEVSGLANHEITAVLRADSSYVELDDLKAERVDVVGAAYRHDVLSTNEYLLRVLADPGAHRLSTALHVVNAADDPGHPSADAGRWVELAEWVSTHVLPHGGHYFVRTVADEVAARVLAALGAVSVAR
ncbi:amino acid adenylation domain-containing protein [Actinokineospora sp. NBRC 105648]|uniref:non-ribosomal peptide synthetase n=1 Tax=Actinokineospora sp. NBRC 105648 TaxID=3032206 RepID=UPI00249FD139|nr:amino acid adenylation domain-containing protein [Actinokineospora sp. NBRC 105648]GLZ39376.1 amino acid adenylation protein [Actinokineospora sp. NBRC 105648]